MSIRMNDEMKTTLALVDNGEPSAETLEEFTGGKGEDDDEQQPVG